MKHDARTSVQADAVKADTMKADAVKANAVKADAVKEDAAKKDAAKAEEADEEIKETEKATALNTKVAPPPPPPRDADELEAASALVGTAASAAVRSKRRKVSAAPSHGSADLEYHSIDKNSNAQRSSAEKFEEHANHFLNIPFQPTPHGLIVSSHTVTHPGIAYYAWGKLHSPRARRDA